MPMRDPPDSAMVELDICRTKRSSDCPAEVNLAPKALHVPPRREDGTSAAQSAIPGFAERFVTTLIRALAAWPT
jgi:hypothetical protein